MKFIILLILIIHVFFSNSLLDGEDIEQDRNKFTASVVIKYVDGTVKYVSGAVIHKKVVITTCSPLENARKAVVLIKSKMKVHVHAVYRHPNYTTDEHTFTKYDVCLLLLALTQEENQNLQPVPYATIEFFHYINDSMCVFGFGNRTGFGCNAGDNYENVRNMNMMVNATRSARSVIATDCKPFYGEDEWYLNICAYGLSDESRTTHCNGDEGAPLVRKSDNDTKYTLIGIARKYELGSQKPVIYARISEFADWIETTITEHYRKRKF